MNKKYNKKIAENDDDNEIIERTKNDVIDVTTRKIKHIIYESENDDAEPIQEDKQKISKKQLSERKLLALEHARNVRTEKALIKSQTKVKDKVVLTKLLQKEIGENLKGGIEQKLEKKLKKQILEDLKQRKLNELKKKYNYKSSSSDSEESEDESEDEKPIKKKKNIKKDVPIVKAKKESSEVLQLYNKYKF